MNASINILSVIAICDVAIVYLDKHESQVNTVVRVYCTGLLSQDADGDRGNLVSLAPPPSHNLEHSHAERHGEHP